MSHYSVVRVADLSKGLILASERYDPRRKQNKTSGERVIENVHVINNTINPKSKSLDATERYIVLNTGDAKEGVISVSKSSVDISEVGSVKKRVQPGDVIISRLRPYLRQIAFIDKGIAIINNEKINILCSTEFYVLRSRDKTSIAFIVPFLLSEHVQSIFSAAQEGGHHPRFNLQTLEDLIIPKKIINKRENISKLVESSVRKIRIGGCQLNDLINSEKI